MELEDLFLPTAHSSVCSVNPNTVLSPGSNQTSGNMVSNPQKTHRRPKARRSCLSCQRSHRTCGNERPCQMCIRRGLGHTCYDGVRKKPKYLEEAPGSLVMEITPFICTNDAPPTVQRRGEQKEPLRFVTPGEYSLLEWSFLENTIAEKIAFWGLRARCKQSSCGSDEETKVKRSEYPKYLHVVSDNHCLDDIATLNISSQRDANMGLAPRMGECNSHAEFASNTNNQLAFAIKTGWSSTFF